MEDKFMNPLRGMKGLESNKLGQGIKEDLEKKARLEKAWEDANEKGDIRGYKNKDEYAAALIGSGTPLEEAVTLSQGYEGNVTEFNVRETKAKLEAELTQLVKNGGITGDEAMARLRDFNTVISGAGPSGEMGTQAASAEGAASSGQVNVASVMGGIGSPLSAKAKAALEESYKAEGLAAGEREKARQKEAEVRDSLMQDRMDAIAKEAELQETLFNARRTASENVTSAIQAGLQNLDTMKINPFRIYENGIAAVGAAIATALGAYAQGLSGGKIPNVALDILNKAEKMDLQAQQAEYNNAKDKIGLANNLYAKLMDQYGDEETALAMYRATSAKWFSHEMERREIAAKSTEEKHTTNLLKKQMNTKAAQFTAEAELKTYNAITQRKAVLGRIAMAQSRAAGKGKGKNKGAKYAFENVANDFESVRNILDEHSEDGQLNTWEFLAGTTAWEMGDVAKLFASPTLTAKQRKLLSALSPYITKSVFAIAKGLDEGSRVTDSDARLIQPRALNWYDFKDRASFEGKAESWNRISNKAAELEALHGSGWLSKLYPDKSAGAGYGSISAFVEDASRAPNQVMR